MVIGPVVAYIVTKRICLGLQRKDLNLLYHGLETGIIHMSPDGEFWEEHRPVPERVRAVLLARQESALALPIAHGDGAEDDVPDPATRGALGKVRLRLGKVLAEGVPLVLANGHGNGHGGNGHGNGHGTVSGPGQAEQAAVTSGRPTGGGPPAGARVGH